MRLSTRLLFVILPAAALITPLSSAQAQVRPVLKPATEGRVQRITLHDGSELLGRIRTVSDSTVEFESSLGVTVIPIASIMAVKEELPGTLRRGRYYFPNPNETRLIFAPTGRMLPQGEGYFSDYWIFFPGVAVGVSDRFTMGGGMSIFPGVGIGDQIFYITPKVGIVQGPKFNAAVGVLAAGFPFDAGGTDGSSTAGVAYGVGTWGEPDGSFTAGLGYGFVNGRLADQPVLMLGGEARASPRISFVTENYLFPGSNTALSAGLRFMGRGVSIDFALARLMGDGESFCCVPFLGVVWKW